MQFPKLTQPEERSRQGSLRVLVGLGILSVTFAAQIAATYLMTLM